ncbi:AraC family transcriptional regulator [Rhodoferax saidenbachensis]|uniref:AraC family transcriptional regulator n=1 Tax=Rhodoferax saidenbachensis TaxID=1484693 RepID=UPI0019D3635A|nr:AraC family transcriptional regulator [Rhodoferax saidenbachensis]
MTSYEVQNVSAGMAKEMIQARALGGFRMLVEAHGGDPKALLTRCKIPLAALTKPDLPISLDSLASLYDHAAQVLEMEDFGLQLSRCQDLTLYGPLALIVLHAQTVGDALVGLMRHFAFHTPGASFQIADDADPDVICVRYALNLQPGTPSRQIVEQSYGMAAKLWSTMVPSEAAQARILLRHAPAVPPRVYEKSFGCPCSFEQETDAIVLPRRALDFVVPHADPELVATAEGYIATIMRRHPLDLAQQVKALVAEQLAFGGATIENIAGQLKMQKRKLQRLLAEQGLYFESIVDELRCDLATEYLGNAALSLQTVGTMLGYNEQSSFTRACKRWFDASPKLVRQTRLAAP